MVNSFLIPHFGSKKLHQINGKLISRYIDKRSATNRVTAYRKDGMKIIQDTGRKIRPTSINKENVALRGIFKYAVKMGWISQIPLIENEPRELETKPYFTKSEWQKLKAFLANWHTEIRGTDATLQRYYRQALSDFCQLISYSGLRTGEASKLKWRDWETKEETDGHRYAVLVVRAQERGAGKTGARRAVGLDKVNETLGGRKDRLERAEPDEYVFAHLSRAVGF